jgi:Putative MetA-pathway of phenol degradation
MAPTPGHEDALENRVLEQADEDDKLTSLESRIAFKYNHAAFNDGSGGEFLRVEWVQAFGPSQRMAVRFELPLIRVSGDTHEPNATGVGDILLEFIGMLGKTEKFEHSAALEVTVPSANDALARLGVIGGEGETAIKPAWGFATQVTARTELSGNLSYIKALHARHGFEGTNQIEPQLILSRAFSKRVGGFLEWSTYYDFNANRWAQALQVGIDFLLDRKEKWNLSPHFAFALNDFAREEEFKNAAGFDLSYHF